VCYNDGAKKRTPGRLPGVLVYQRVLIYFESLRLVLLYANGDLAMRFMLELSHYFSAEGNQPSLPLEGKVARQRRMRCYRLLCADTSSAPSSAPSPQGEGFWLAGFAQLKSNA
jgi:hypothetical protein